MSPSRAELVIRGQVVVAAEPERMETAEAIGIAAGRVVGVGRFADVSDAAARGARVVDARDSAVVPGIHDFHIHLVGLARSRLAIALDDAADGRDLVERVAGAAAAAAHGSWLVGRGWGERHLADMVAEAL